MNQNSKKRKNTSEESTIPEKKRIVETVEGTDYLISIDAVINSGGCSICTSWVHATKDCNSTQKECGHIDGGVKCTKTHSRYFHALTHPY